MKTWKIWNELSQSVLGNFPLLVLVAAAVALRRHWFKARALALVWTLPIFSTAVALTSWGSWRFRMPADIGIIVLSASLQEASNRKCAVDTRI